MSGGLLERARASGKCPPSLLGENMPDEDFEKAVGSVLDSQGTRGSVSVTPHRMMHVVSDVTLYLWQVSISLLKQRQQKPLV